MATTDAQLKMEIARLQASIDQRKMQQQQRPNAYFNPSFRKPTDTKIASTDKVKDVVIGGVAFQSSSRSLVRKDLPKLPSTSSSKPPSRGDSQTFARRSGHLVPTGRVYKPKSTRGRSRATNKNMTLTNSRRPYHARIAAKRAKYSEKSCPRFTSTGACSKGLTCMYQHDPHKIAICWRFLQGTCTKTNETCALSHDPTPERTPLCQHFINGHHCTRPNCPFPHVNVGPREGICRDFAVLGYCSKGLDCEHRHVRECPYFAEHGTCAIRGCKLPHVIRANRQKTATASKTESTSKPEIPEAVHVTADDAQLGDDFISLTFNESDSSEEDSDDDEEEGEDESDADEDSRGGISGS